MGFSIFFFICVVHSCFQYTVLQKVDNFAGTFTVNETNFFLKIEPKIMYVHCTYIAGTFSLILKHSRKSHFWLTACCLRSLSMGRCSWALQKCGALADVGNYYQVVAWLFTFIGRNLFYFRMKLINYNFNVQ